MIKIKIEVWYIIALLIIAIGYCWIFYFSLLLKNSNTIETVCLFKLATNLPCPSCGITRATRLAFGLNFINSIKYNPLGIIAALSLILAPLWICFDLLLDKNTLKMSFILFIGKLKEKRIAITFALIIMLIWLWKLNYRI